MASIKIHVDQENKMPDLRQKQSNTAMAAKQKRPVLGVIDHNNHNKVPTKIAPKGKQPLKETKAAKTCTENVRNAENRKNVVVPVAQFQAFTVYEDDENRARIDQKLRLISKSNVYKGTAEDRFITKAELAELERKKQQGREVPAPRSEPDFDSPATPLPMSIEKPDESTQQDQAVLQGINHDYDAFYEVEEYRDDIYAYLRERELLHRAKSGYIHKQPDVSDNMRAILVDWLVEVTEEYKMHTETLYLAVNFIDRFLSYMSVVRAKLQLVGTAAMFIASKYEEILPPDVHEFVYITDDTYNTQQIIRMEHLILRVLGFDLSVPTPLTFIHAICVSSKITKKTMYLAMYLSELALLEVEPFLQFLPSMVAASALALALHTLGRDAWSECLCENTGYALGHLQKCTEFLYDIFVKAPNNPKHAIQDKYKSDVYLQVSKILPKNGMIRFE